MFALTPRLLLRPGWPEDAPALAAAIGHEAVARMTARVPWPYRLEDANAHLAQPVAPALPRCLIVERGTRTVEARLVGGVGLFRDGESPEIGYWLTPDVWGRGYGTEAVAAMIAHARHALGLSHLVAGHFADNPASGRVLRKLGFRPTGTVADYPSLARGGGAEAVRYRLTLDPPERSVALPAAA